MPMEEEAQVNGRGKSVLALHQRALLFIAALQPVLGCLASADLPHASWPDSANSGSTPTVQSPPPVAPRSLIVTDLDVVVDPTRTIEPRTARPDDRLRVWSFGHLMQLVADQLGIDAPEMVLRWLESW